MGMSESVLIVKLSVDLIPAARVMKSAIVAGGAPDAS